MFSSVQAVGAGPGGCAWVPDPRGLMVRVARDEEIVAEGERAEQCYLITRGCARTVRLLQDGRRQIGEFLLAGEIFGWEALDVHDFGAEAVSAVELRRYPRRGIEVLAEQDRDFGRRLRALTAGQVRAGRERMVLLGRKTAPERIASFLLEMAARLGAAEGIVELPMGRADIADYLGLTIETVCRGLTELRRRGVVGVERGGVRIRDRGALGVAGGVVVH